MLAAPNGVTVTLKDGRELQRIREHIHGSRPTRSPTRSSSSFTTYTAGLLSADQVATVVDLVNRLEELPNLDELLAIVAPA